MNILLILAIFWPALAGLGVFLMPTCKENRQLRGRAVVVGGRRAVAPIEGDDFPHLRGYSGRGVITTATYEARALGVH